MKENGGARLTAVIMASGHGKRFGSNKLLAEFRGRPLIENLFAALPAERFEKTVVVSLYDEVLEIAEKYGFEGVKNRDTTDDTAVTVRLGCENAAPGSEGLMFFAGDQPFLRKETVETLVCEFSLDKTRIVLPVCGGKRGNPVIFPADLLGELSSLRKDGRGRDVIRTHPDRVSEIVFESPGDFFDIDYKEDIKNAEKMAPTGR